MENERKKSISSVRKESEHQSYKFDSTVKASEDVQNLSKELTLQKYLEYSKELNFKGQSVVRIDNDLHALLGMLKKKTGVEISQITNTLLLDFAKKYEVEIKKINKNKYL